MLFNPKSLAQESTLLTWDRKTPVDLDSVLRYCNFTVDDTAILPYPAYVGYDRYKNTRTEIVVARNLQEVKKRYTIAHGIARLLNDTSNHYISSDHFCSNNKEYWTYNLLALYLLIPREAIKYFIYKKNISDIGELAKIFEVSEVAVQKRLVEEGLLTERIW